MTAEHAILEVDAEAGALPLAPRASADRWRVAYGILDLARLHSGAPHAAIYAHGADTLHLLALRGVGQPGLDLVARLWRDRELRPGRAWADDASRSVVLPCGSPDAVVGVVLLQWPSDETMRAAPGLPALVSVVTALLQRLDVVGRTEAHVATLESGVAFPRVRAASEPTASGMALRALLEEHEWNVSRVARLLGVTRMTVYNRLRRQGIARERVVKAPTRREL
jgi:hypothetical protein